MRPNPTVADLEQPIRQQERKASMALASIFAFRMLGLFMILPVFALYADELAHVSPSLIGIAMGCYGLTQAALQLPFGMLSDRLGRKPVICAGLLIFATGSVIAAMSSSIYGVILGRSLQGAGAIGSTTMALLADLTREEHRTKSMAIVGMTIGLSFAVGMILGPILNTWAGVQGIFWLTAGLAIAGIIILYGLVPTPAHSQPTRDTAPVISQLRRLFMHPELFRLNLGIFSLHCILTASFIVLPLVLEHLYLPEAQQWQIYIPVLLGAVTLMIPFMIYAEKKRRIKPVLLGGILMLAAMELCWWLQPHHLYSMGASLTLFFAAFTLLEALLPSLISRTAPAASKGTAMGIYSCCQFFGIFVGGSLGGWLFGRHELQGVFLFCATVAGVWFAVSSAMQNPRAVITKLLATGPLSQTQASALQAKLLSNPGILEVAIIPEEQTAYIKIDKSEISPEDLPALIL